MPGPADLPEVLHPFVAAPARSGLFCDFDGTLAAIVADPAAARPVDGAVAVIEGLAARLGVVAVLSGRPVAFLEPFFGPHITLAGVYGLEQRIDGERHDHPDGERWRAVIAEVVDRAVGGGPAGMRTESKGLSLTLHFRGRPELEGAVRDWAGAEAARTGLELRGARQSFELHPPVPADKGTTLEALAAGLDAVGVAGDDVGDLPAFDAVDRLAAHGVAGARIGVRSSEESGELVTRADLLVDGPAGVVALLGDLLDALG